MVNGHKKRGINILLVEDNAADIRLTKEVLQEIEFVKNLIVVRDGVDAINFLKNKGKYSEVILPDLILLDLNLPKKGGLEVLKEIKEDEDLKSIPVVILTISDVEDDIIKAYKLHVNSYVIKPLEMREFHKIIESIMNYWFIIVKLPERK
ncbi:MAG: response regulator [Candidatus Thorarchaeota archaeon]